MTEHIHRTPAHLPRADASAQIDGEDSEARIDGVLSLALYDPDWRWVQARLLGLLDDEDRDVVATAILGLGHIARLHHAIDVDLVVPELERLRSDPNLAGRVDDVLDDIEVYVSADQT